MDLQLDEKVVLVTGSNRGTGCGVAGVLAAEGATVIVHGFEQAGAETVAEELRAAGGRAHAVSGDIRTDAGADATVAAVRDVTDHLDVLVNNYGVAEGGGWLDGTSDDWLDIYHKNVLSGVRLVRHFLPEMVERRSGRVIFVSTVGATRPREQMPHYYASKAALVNMAVSLAKEVAGSGVTVNTVSPGIIATAEVRESMTRRAARRGLGTDWAQVEKVAMEEFMPVPVGRIGRVEDVGYLIAFLASDLAGYINAANLRIDGGSAECTN